MDYFMNPNFSDCGCQNQTPQFTMPSSPSTSRGYVSTGSVQCPGSVTGPVECYPIGMGYVPVQQWGQTYNLERALSRGTIFPELDLPFVMGRCQ